MTNLYECEPSNSTMRYNVLAENETEALQKLRHAIGLKEDIGVSIKRKEYMGWFIF